MTTVTSCVPRAATGLVSASPRSMPFAHLGLRPSSIGSRKLSALPSDSTHGGFLALGLLRESADGLAAAQGAMAVEM
jgi:hypothetical protein